MQSMSTMTSIHEVPTFHWNLEEEDGPIIEDVFLGYNTPPLTPLTSCVAGVEPEQDINNGGFYPIQNAHRQQNATFNNPLIPNNQHPNLTENKWFDDYVNFTEETFGSSSKSLPISSNFPANTSYDPDYDAGTFYSNFANLHQPNNSDRQIQDLSGPSTSISNGTSSAPNGTSASFQFSQLNIRESSSSVSADITLRPPIPESEYSASYSAPNSTSSSDWSSDHSSARSQDEIFHEILNECAEIERKSVSPPARHKSHYKKRSVTTLQRSSVEHIASNSSNNSLAGGTSDRKKELNRIAATKYREKRRLEREMLGSEHSQLETRNHLLRSTIKELKTEVNYLRKLMKDMESRAKQS